MNIEGNKGSEEIDTLFDSGSNRTFMIKEKAEKICDVQYFDEPRKVKLPNGNEINSIGKCLFETKINDKPVHDEMEVLDIQKGEDRPEMYIGAPTLQKFKLILRFSEEEGGDYVDTSEYQNAYLY
jgi:hypothetical protein